MGSKYVNVIHQYVHIVSMYHSKLENYGGQKTLKRLLQITKQRINYKGIIEAKNLS